jgi:hypothetical protein
LEVPFRAQPLSMSNVASSSRGALYGIQLSTVHRRNWCVIPDTQLWHPVSRTVIALPFLHTTTPRRPPPALPEISAKSRGIQRAIMSFRPGSRIFSSFRPFFRQAQADARRRASTATGPGGFAGFMNSPIGPKTVHFWYVFPPTITTTLNAPATANLPGPSNTNLY